MSPLLLSHYSRGGGFIFPRGKWAWLRGGGALECGEYWEVEVVWGIVEGLF
jgi:hypothetical protein